MSEPKLISPMLDGYAVGGPISDHNGVRCYPAMENETDNKCIVKIISIPASQTQLDALLLTGAYATKEDALSYFKSLADGVIEEAEILNRLSRLEGFLPYNSWQTVPMEDCTGYEVYLLSTYRRTLEKCFRRQPLTHLGAINLGLDLCASLAVCRRSGYLYVALKPNNVYVTAEQTFSIGDLGFIRLDSLQYASLPDKYRSAYTAPEITDAFSSLNATVDIYAVGLILYQAYNNGELPFTGNTAPDQVFPAPAYADYEMAEIILKACAPNPQDRWQDPLQMGQALVSYMQRNGANDTPIIPPAPPVCPDEIAEPIPEAPQEASTQETTADEIADVPEVISADDAVMVDDSTETETPPPSETSDEEDEFENLSFLSDEDMLPEMSDISYTEVSEDVTAMLEQADDLAAHPVPAPAVAPDPVEIPMPEPIVDAQHPSEEADDLPASDAPAAEEDLQAPPETTPDAEETTEEAPKRKRHWVRNSLLVLLLLSLLTAGVFFVQQYYFVTIDSIEVIGSEDSMTVLVKSDIDTSILSVVCSDSHGNQFTKPVVDGVATFKGLVPDTGYTVKVVVTGFHRITGDASTAYSTPVQTSIVQFSAVTGAEDGTAILGFTVDGLDSDQWNVHYWADGEEEKVATFPSHMVTLTDLTVGKQYTFRLVPEADLYITGNDEIQFTASKLIYAENLTIVSCMDNALTLTWTAPADSAIESWAVHCYNGDDYSETIFTSEPTATFVNLDYTDSFTVEVTAAGMSVSQRVFVPENTITVKNIQTDTTDPSKLVLSWEASDNAPDGWLLLYAVDDSEVQEVLCLGNTAEISPLIPGATYSITLQDTTGRLILGMPYTYTSPDSSPFQCSYEGYEVTAEDMVFSMCKTPSSSNWNRYYLSDSDYTTTFAVGEKASFLVKLKKSYGVSDQIITTLFVMRNADGKIVSCPSVQHTWTDMWYRNYCELDIPSLPDTPGDYTVDIYFNGALAGTQAFTITA